jgi:hypothetical protein
MQKNIVVVRKYGFIHSTIENYLEKINIKQQAKKTFQVKQIGRKSDQIAVETALPKHFCC